VRISRVALLLALIGGGCHRNGETVDEVHPVPVRVQPVARGDVPDTVEVAGTLEPLPGLDVKLAPVVAGRLSQILTAEGEHVRAGQVLARLDPLPLRDSVAQAEAQLGQAEAQESNASTKYERARQAFTAGVASGQEVDDARLQLESARAAVRTARAALSTARNQLARSELRAPFDGVVAKVSAAPGEPVDASKPVVEVADTDVLELRAPVASRDAMRLRQGQPATVVVDAAPDQKFAGTVLAVAPAVDPATGAALVRIRVPNSSGILKANSVAHARVIVDVHRGTLLVPREAIVGGAEGPGIEIVQDGKARRAPVKLGYQDGEIVELLAGVQEGQPVIVQGAYALPDDTPVEPLAAPDAGLGETSAVPAKGKSG
jgi:membrane fusion protein (multidrug efflux system)